ncbi:MAG TPA: dihydrofolate reductase family protein [Actinomycetota bacterium]|nr:dihydrofolate reductase family protein [Actinomycetota bacterium]
MTDLGVRLESLFDERSEAAAIPLPTELEAAYGGPFVLPEEVVYANFVTSIDGVAAIEGVKASSAAISGAEPADRFVMALLRGVADAIVVGTGTLKEHGGPWTAEKAYPPVAGRIGEIRAEVSTTPAPTLVVVTASGELPPDHPSLPDAVVVTTASGARAVAERAIRCAEVIDVGDTEDVDAAAAIARLRDRGHRRILTEGGPSLMGSMLVAGAVDQLFLTISPRLLGGGDERPPLSGGTDLLATALGGTLLGLRRAGDYLFLRYELRPGEAPTED